MFDEAFREEEEDETETSSASDDENVSHNKRVTQ